MKTAGRRVFEILGRLAALAAVIVGIVLSAHMFADSYEGAVKTLIVTTGLAAVTGGLLYLLGLDRWRGRQGVMARALGWLLFTSAFLLPNALQMLLVSGSLLAAPAIPEWGKSAALASQSTFPAEAP